MQSWISYFCCRMFYAIFTGGDTEQTETDASHWQIDIAVCDSIPMKEVTPT